MTFEEFPSCPECSSHDVERHDEGRGLLVIRCNECGCAIITSQLPKVILDDTEYCVQVDTSNGNRCHAILAIKHLLNLSTCEARDVANSGPVEVLKGRASALVEKVANLRKEGVTLIIKPEFNYTMDDMKIEQVITTDSTVPSEGVPSDVQ